MNLPMSLTRHTAGYLSGYLAHAAKRCRFPPGKRQIRPFSRAYVLDMQGDYIRSPRMSARIRLAPLKHIYQLNYMTDSLSISIVLAIDNDNNIRLPIPGASPMGIDLDAFLLSHGSRCAPTVGYPPEASNGLLFIFSLTMSITII